MINKLNFTLLATCLVLSFGCRENSDFPLDPFFEDLKKNSPKDVLEQFKAAPYDSAVIGYEQYSEIFTEAAAIVLQDSAQMILFESYFEENGISLVSKQDIYTIVAAFHKRLNNKKVDIKSLRQEMVSAQNVVAFRHKLAEPEQPNEASGISA